MITFTQTTQMSGSHLMRTLKPSRELVSALAAALDGDDFHEDGYGPTYAFAVSVDGVRRGGITIYTRYGTPRLGGWGEITDVELDAFEKWLPRHLLGILTGA